jgi:SNF2 family DNA or RNA helicase
MKATCTYIPDPIFYYKKARPFFNFFFQLLVNVFSKQFNSDKHSHLKNFYMIVPALSINFVEYLIGAKEKMLKNNKDGAAFTDDGMAMGKTVNTVKV